MRLVLIGLAAGFFGALFGVGGGIIMVPMLMTVARFPLRPATATSLAAIGLIALEGSIFFAAHGDVKPLDAALLGIPGAFGALVATGLQQRLDVRLLSYGFAVLLVAVAVRLLV